jgi:PBP1b-binding outer membrane lipoprotein LpoB
MKTQLIIILLMAILFASCARSVTPSEAASGKYKKCRGVM